MKTAIRIVIALGIIAVIAMVFARMMQRDVEIVQTVETTPEPDETEAPTEELAEASA